MHIYSNGIQGHGGLQTTSEVIWSQIWNLQSWLPWYQCEYCLQQPPRPWWPLRPWRPLNNLWGNMTSDLTSAIFSTLLSMWILPPMAYEAMAVSKQPRRSYDLRFDISNLNYSGIHVHNASNSHFGGLWGRGDLQMTSEVTSDLRIELGDLNYLCSHVSLASNCLQWPYLPRRPIMTHWPAWLRRR